MFFKEPLTEWLFVEPKMVLLWHRSEEPLYLKVHAPDYHLKSTISDNLETFRFVREDTTEVKNSIYTSLPMTSLYLILPR